jgi:hypothetical protein
MTQPDFTPSQVGGPNDPEAKELLADGEVLPDGGDLDQGGDDGKDDLDAKLMDKHERAVVAAAMRLLQHARKRSTRTDSDDGTVLRLDGGGKLDKVARTTLGGARVPATLTRTGVLNYRRGDGTVRRELRLPEEVFHADSLETLRGAPVTVGHPYEIGGLLDAGTYRKFTVGHAEDIRQDGKQFVAGNLVVQDGKTGDAIDRGELTEVSLGYQCRMDETPGVWNGQPYDAIQRGIKYNHVALLAPGRSRADVGLRLDAADAVFIDPQEQEDKPMTVKIKLDGKDFEFGSEAHIEKIEAMHSAAVTKLDEKLSEKKEALKAATSEKETLQGKLDALQKKLDEKTTELAAANDPKALADRVNARVELVTKARSILGAEAKLDDKSDRDIMIDVIKTDESDFDGAKRSDDYLRGRYESLESKAVRADSIDAVVRTIENAKRLDANDPNLSPVVKAQIASIEASRKLASTPVGDK